MTFSYIELEVARHLGPTRLRALVAEARTAAKRATAADRPKALARLARVKALAAEVAA
jgi:hypothetical protein